MGAGGAGGWQRSPTFLHLYTLYRIPELTQLASTTKSRCQVRLAGLQLSTLPPFFLSSSQVTTEEAPAVPEHIQLAGAQGKGHFCYPSARKGQLQVSFSGSPLAASSAGPAFCSPHQGLSPSHLQKKQPLLTGEWEKVPLTLLTVLLTITELNNSVCTYSWAEHQHLQELH